MPTAAAKKKVFTYAMQNVVNAHKGYFFSPDTMRFFKSRLPAWAFTNEGDPYNGEAKTLYFVTTERGPNMPRRATIRRYDVDADNISTAGEFQEYASPAAATRALIRFLEA